jgi:hypothetical protein
VPFPPGSGGVFTLSRFRVDTPYPLIDRNNAFDNDTRVIRYLHGCNYAEVIHLAIQGREHSKLPPGAAVHVRDKGALIRAEDQEQFSPDFIAAGMLELREALGKLARQTENRSNPVDEYNTASLSGGATTAVVTLQPIYEYMPEKIISVLVAGPPAASVTLILGDRQLPLILPPSGILPIGPLGMILGRNDPRQLVSATPGAYFLELMGWADARFNI